MNRALRISLVTETYFPQVNFVSRTIDRQVRPCTGRVDQVQLLLTEAIPADPRPAMA